MSKGHKELEERIKKELIDGWFAEGKTINDIPKYIAPGKNNPLYSLRTKIKKLQDELDPELLDILVKHGLNLGPQKDYPLDYYIKKVIDWCKENNKDVTVISSKYKPTLYAYLLRAKKEYDTLEEETKKLLKEYKFNPELQIQLSSDETIDLIYLWCKQNNKTLDDIPLRDETGDRHKWRKFLTRIRSGMYVASEEGIAKLNELGMNWEKRLSAEEQIEQRIIPWCIKNNKTVAQIPASINGKQNSMYHLMLAIRKRFNTLDPELQKLLIKYGYTDDLTIQPKSREEQKYDTILAHINRLLDWCKDGKRLSDIPRNNPDGSSFTIYESKKSVKKAYREGKLTRKQGEQMIALGLFELRPPKVAINKVYTQKPTVRTPTKKTVKSKEVKTTPSPKATAKPKATATKSTTKPKQQAAQKPVPTQKAASKPKPTTTLKPTEPAKQAVSFQPESSQPKNDNHAPTIQTQPAKPTGATLIQAEIEKTKPKAAKTKLEPETQPREVSKPVQPKPTVKNASVQKQTDSVSERLPNAETQQQIQPKSESTPPKAKTQPEEPTLIQSKLAQNNSTTPTRPKPKPSLPDPTDLQPTTTPKIADLFESCYVVKNYTEEKIKTTKVKKDPIKTLIEEKREEMYTFQIRPDLEFIYADQVLNEEELLRKQVYDAYRILIQSLTQNDCFYKDLLADIEASRSKTRYSGVKQAIKIITQNYHLLSQSQWDELTYFRFTPDLSLMQHQPQKQVVEYMAFTILRWCNSHSQADQLTGYTSTYTLKQLKRFSKQVSKYYDILGKQYKLAFASLNPHQLQALKEFGFNPPTVVDVN